MPYRRSLPAPIAHPDVDPGGGWPDMEEAVREDVLDPERDHGPHPQTHCSMCGKPLEARLTCVACGDEDFRIRPDAAEGIARVFDGDVGDRRRADDERAA